MDLEDMEDCLTLLPIRFDMSMLEALWCFLSLTGLSCLYVLSHHWLGLPTINGPGLQC